MASIGQVRPGPQAVRAPNIRTPLFVLGVALALVAFIVMLAFGLLFANRSGSATQVQVVVAARGIDAREPITADAITTAWIPTAGVPPEAFKSLGALQGYAAVVSIPKGQVISPNLVTANPDVLSASGASQFLPIPPGWVALTLPTSEQQGVAGYIAQGDYINILATLNTQLFTPLNPRMVTRTTFANVHVIRVGPESSLPKQGQPQGLVSSITVVMTLCDAQYMDWLAVNGQLKYALLSYKDYSTATPPPDTSCPSTTLPTVVGPKQVQARWDFLAG